MDANNCLRSNATRFLPDIYLALLKWTVTCCHLNYNPSKVIKYDLTDSYTEAGMAHADLLYSYM
jgi:hypothetical protein